MSRNNSFLYKITALIMVLALLVPVLAACGDDDEDEETPRATTPTATAPAVTTPPATTPPATKPPATTPPVTTPAATPTATSAPKSPAGVLRVGWVGEGKQMYDMLSGASAGSTLGNLIDPLYESLVGTNWEETEIGTDGGLAIKWEQGADRKSWTFYLRKGMQWDRGYGEITAEDVKFSLDTAIFGAGSKENILRQAQQAIVADIVVIDPYTVRINTKAAAPILPLMLSRLGDWPQSYIVSKKAVEEMGIEAHASKPVSSGPYRFVEHKLGSYAKYEARENYWGRTPRYKEVYIYWIPEESTRVAMLKRGELDIISANNLNAVRLEKDGFQLVEQKGAAQLAISFHNTWEGAFAKKEVREAIEMAINRKELLETLYYGKGSAADLDPWQLVPPGKSLTRGRPYDPKRAKELLAQAGYPNGLDLTLIIREGTLDPTIAEALAGYWQAVGINAKLRTMDLASWMSEWRGGKLKDSITPSKATSYVLKTSSFPMVLYSTSALTRVKDARLDALLDKVNGAGTLEDLIEAQFQTIEYIQDQAYYFTALVTSKFWAANAKLDTMGSNGGGKSLYNWGQRQLLQYK